MPSSQARFLATLIINASLFILSVSAHNHHRHHPNRFFKLKVSAHASVFNSGNKANTSQTPLPKKVSHPHSHEFLISHNRVRADLGEPPLKWDNKLARYARRWASKRAADCKMIHSFGPYGENIFWGGRDHWTPAGVVRSWVNECKYYHKDSNDCESGQMCGHYTQVVWRDTLRVGCFLEKCNNGGVFVICSYDPPGNYVNESPFGTANNPPATPSLTPTPTTPPPPSPPSSPLLPLLTKMPS